MTGPNPYAPPSHDEIYAPLETPNTEANPAGFWIRVVATFIDGLVLSPVAVLSIANTILWKSLAIQVLITIPGLLYKPLMEANFGATLGKRAMSIIVVNAEGTYMTVGQAYLRYAPWLLTTALATANTAMMFADPAFAEIDEFLEMGAAAQPLQTPMTLLNLLFAGGCLLAAFTDRKRALHDYIAKSFVIRTPN